MLVEGTSHPNPKGTFMVNRRRRRPALKITGDGTGVANHAGTRLLADLADAVGSDRRGCRWRWPRPSNAAEATTGVRSLCDLIVAIAGGAETISDLATLRDQPDLFGAVASHPTVWRTLAAIDDAALERIKTARAAARARAWAGGRGSRVLGDRHRRHPRRGAFGQGTGGADVEARVRVPSVARLPGRHR